MELINWKGSFCVSGRNLFSRKWNEQVGILACLRCRIGGNRKDSTHVTRVMMNVIYRSKRKEFECVKLVVKHVEGSGSGPMAIHWSPGEPSVIPVTK